MSSLDASRLENETLISINDVMQNITGVNVSFYDTQRPLYFARGFQITDFQIDGVPTYSGGTQQEYDTVFYSRIDVVRGANGLTTGAGIPSATVNMIRKRPEKAFSAYGGLVMGSEDFHRVEADLNTPITRDGRVQARLIASAQEKDGYRDRHSETKTAFMATVEADLTDSTTLTLGYQDQNNVPKGPIWGTIPRFASDGSLADLPRETSFLAAVDALVAPQRHELRAARAEARRRLDAEGHRQPQRRQHLQPAHLCQRLSGPEDRRGAEAARRRRQELGEARQPGSLRLGHVDAVRPPARFGDRRQRREDDDDHADADLGRLVGYNIPDIRNWDGNAPARRPSAPPAQRVAETEQSGVFAMGRWKILEPLSVITGARLSYWKTGTDAFNAAGNFTARTGA